MADTARGPLDAPDCCPADLRDGRGPCRAIYPVLQPGWSAANIGLVPGIGCIAGLRAQGPADAFGIVGPRAFAGRGGRDHAILPPRGVLLTLSDAAAWLFGVQTPDGVGAGIFAAPVALVVADLTRGTGRFHVTQGAISAAGRRRLALQRRGGLRRGAVRLRPGLPLPRGPGGRRASRLRLRDARTAPPGAGLAEPSAA